MNPVMKQYAARGNVDCCGSTSPIQWRYEKTSRGFAKSCAVWRSVPGESCCTAGWGREGPSFSVGSSLLMLVGKSYVDDQEKSLDGLVDPDGTRIAGDQGGASGIGGGFEGDGMVQ